MWSHQIQLSCLQFCLGRPLCVCLVCYYVYIVGRTTSCLVWVIRFWYNHNNQARFVSSAITQHWNKFGTWNKLRHVKDWASLVPRPSHTKTTIGGEGLDKLAHFRCSPPRFWRHQSDHSCHMTKPQLFNNKTMNVLFKCALKRVIMWLSTKRAISCQSSPAHEAVNHLAC